MNELRDNIYRNGFVCILCLLLFVLILSMCSCRSLRTITVPEIHKEVVHQRDTLALKDSIFVHDSISVEIVRGDTTYLYTTRWRTEYRDRWRDRIVKQNVCLTDSVPVVVEVEKPPNFMNRLRLSIPLAITLTLLLLIIIRYIRNRFLLK